ncbi:MAG: radical SAM protein [bacterium]|nr:MAG: radical SAM protein [bacterium]
MSKTTSTTRRVAIITNNVGCERHVQYYSTLEKYLVANNWTVAEDFDVEKVIICACGFHDFMMDKVSKLLKRLSEIGFSEKDVIITGCLPKTHEQLLKQEFNGDLVELNQEHLLDDIIDAKIPFRSVSLPNVFVRPKTWQIPQDKTFFIKIAQGCVGHCTYCVIKKAKGHIRSVPFEEIKKQFEYATANGYKEIYLMGEDTFAWGADIGTNIIALVDSLLKISPDVSFIFGNWHSRWLSQFSEDLIRLCKMGIIKKLSIGLQHVNQFLLRRMGRAINFHEFYGILRRFRAECPDLHLSADIMVGFPGETPEMFEELVAFFEKDTVFDLVAHFGYSDVQGAPSSKFDAKVDTLQVGRRWDRLKKTLGQRSYYNAIETPETIRAVFQLSLDRDYTFCKDTYLKELR